jgi:hypothetical protein
MATRRIRSGPRMLGTLLLALTGFAPVARAAVPVQDDGDYGWKNVLHYGRCAVLVLLASTPASWSVAFFDCARTYEAEPPIGGRP